MLFWFPRSVPLADLGVRWRESASNYDPDQPIDSSWHVDGYEIPLGSAEDERLFEKAVELLFACRFYPPQVLQDTADFLIEKRPPRPGDRIIQRIRVIPGLLDAAVMNIVTAAWHEPDRRGFTVHTSSWHFEMGEWTATVTRSRRPGGKVSLLVHAISKPDGRIPAPGRGFARVLQLRAHRLGIEHFTKLVRGVAGARRPHGNASR